MVNSGDAEAAIAPYEGWLWRTATGILHPSHPDLEDLVQEGRITMWKALLSHDGTQGSLPHWLTYKARFRMKEVVMQKNWINRPEPIGAPEVLEHRLSRHRWMECAEIAYHRAEIERATSELPSAQRRYVLARFWDGLNTTELKNEVFGYDASGLWNSRKNGARFKLMKKLAHLADMG